jgi:putative transposase
MPDWPHAPVHRLDEAGTYMVTAGTYGKRRVLHDTARLALVHDLLLETLAHYGWHLQAWAVLANHYHFVALSPDNPKTLKAAVKKLHSATALRLNALDATPGRKVWFEYWETQITYQRSYLARLRYVHENPVKHGVVAAPEAYPWCSAAWFARTASAAFRRTVQSFKIDELSVEDDF